jgi:hypothetical protein
MCRVIPNSRPKRHPEHPFSSPSERSLSLPRPPCRCRPRRPAGGPRQFALSSRPSAGCSRRRQRTPARRDGTTRRVPISLSTPAWHARCTDYEHLGCSDHGAGTYPRRTNRFRCCAEVPSQPVGAAATQTVPQGHSVQRRHCHPLPVASGSRLWSSGAAHVAVRPFNGAIALTLTPWEGVFRRDDGTLRYAARKME